MFTLLDNCRRFLRRIKLTRITSGGRVLPEIEGLRFVAIAVVVLHHLCGQLLRKHHFSMTPIESFIADILDREGRFGVMLFFTISGFILALRFAQEHLGTGRPVDLRSYYLRRLTRLEPPFLINALLCLPIAIAVNMHSVHGGQYIASLLYLHGSFFHSDPIINGVTWSLEIEIQFYILAPLFGSLYRARSRAIRYTVIILLVVVTTVIGHRFSDCRALTFSVVYYLPYFMLGFLLAEIYVDGWKELPTRAWMWDLASATGWTALIVLLHRYPIRYPDLTNPFVLVFIMLAYMGAMRGRASGYILTGAPIRMIGGMCYSVYLYHFTVIIILSKLTFQLVKGSSFSLNLLTQAALLLPAVMLISCAMFVVIERPCMDKNWPAKLKIRLVDYITMRDQRRFNRSREVIRAEYAFSNTSVDVTTSSPLDKKTSTDVGIA